MDGVEDLQVDARAGLGVLDLRPEVVDGQALHDEGGLEDERPDDDEAEERPDPGAAQGGVGEDALVEEQDGDLAEAEVGEVEELEGVEGLGCFHQSLEARFWIVQSVGGLRGLMRGRSGLT